MDQKSSFREGDTTRRLLPHNGSASDWEYNNDD